MDWACTLLLSDILSLLGAIELNVYVMVERFERFGERDEIRLDICVYRCMYMYRVFGIGGRRFVYVQMDLGFNLGLEKG